MTSLTESDAAALATLTKTERDVLVLAAKGLTSREVANTTSTSILTVRDHLKAIRRKLDVHSTIEAAVIAAKAGWV